MELLSEELKNLVFQIASKNNIANFTVELNKSISKEGDGYIGLLEGLFIIDKDSEKKLNLVIKKAPTNKNLRKQFPTRDCFIREIGMYNTVFPKFLSFQEKYNIPNPFKSITECYEYIDDEYKETLILKNLKADGYKLCNRREPMDSQHLSLVITEYARWHAISHAMKHLEPEMFEEITKGVKETVMPRNAQNQGTSVEGQGNFLFGPTLEVLKDRPKEMEVFKNFMKNIFKFMIQDVFRTTETKVIIHADCWSANLMFKYEDDNRPHIPTKLCLIDWQMSYLGTPIHDLSYFLFINAGKYDLKNYMRYLHLYYTALSENLKAFGVDPEQVYSFKVFEEEWKKYSKIGFFMCLVMMHQTLSEKKTHDFEELAKDGQDVMEAMNNKPREIFDLFRQRMGDLVEFVVEQNII